ncbi:hypothetical protein SDC9_159487 [bioreactor metagenome]|uniref:Uncharacterized protein n=1 Tax=bioreactor metagenome TaxID=1076179 RepID=A0A645FCR3_9ZZZZ
MLPGLKQAAQSLAKTVVSFPGQAENQFGVGRNSVRGIPPFKLSKMVYIHVFSADEFKRFLVERLVRNRDTFIRTVEVQNLSGLKNRFVAVFGIGGSENTGIPGFFSHLYNQFSDVRVTRVYAEIGIGTIAIFNMVAGHPFEVFVHSFHRKIPYILGVTPLAKRAVIGASAIGFDNGVKGYIGVFFYQRVKNTGGIGGRIRVQIILVFRFVHKDTGLRPIGQVRDIFISAV